MSQAKLDRPEWTDTKKCTNEPGPNEKVHTGQGHVCQGQMRQTQIGHAIERIAGEKQPWDHAPRSVFFVFKGGGECPGQSQSPKFGKRPFFNVFSNLGGEGREGK